MEAAPRGVRSARPAAKTKSARTSPQRCPRCQRADQAEPGRPPRISKQNPCPATGKTSGACPGYIVDHVVALKRRGPYQPSNMQWLAVTDPTAKARIA